MDKQKALRLIEGKPWHHDFEIIPGVRTHGNYDPAELWHDLQLPEDLRGVSVADVGASNGYFSFGARQRGARVVAFDFRHKLNSGFGLLQHINGLNDIEHHQVNIVDFSPNEYGRFDIVLALGLLYHVADPYRALTNCAALSQDRLLIESYCIDKMVPPALALEPIMRFIPDPVRFPNEGQPNNDRSNFWGFTSVCLKRLVEEMGFTVNRANVRADRVLIDAKRVVFDGDTTRQNLAYGLVAPVNANRDPDDPDSWRII